MVVLSQTWLLAQQPEAASWLQGHKIAQETTQEFNQIWMQLLKPSTASGSFYHVLTILGIFLAVSTLLVFMT